MDNPSVMRGKGRCDPKVGIKIRGLAERRRRVSRKEGHIKGGLEMLSPPPLVFQRRLRYK